MSIPVGLVQLENSLKVTQADKIIALYLRRFGVVVNVIRDKLLTKHIRDNNLHTEEIIDAAIEVYGVTSGLTIAESNVFDLNSDAINVRFKAMVFFSRTVVSPLDAAMSGSFERELLYSDGVLNPNDIISLEDSLGVEKRYIITVPEQVGRACTVFKRWRVDQIGGIGL